MNYLDLVMDSARVALSTADTVHSAIHGIMWLTAFYLLVLVRRGLWAMVRPRPLVLGELARRIIGILDHPKMYLAGDHLTFGDAAAAGGQNANGPGHNLSLLPWSCIHLNGVTNLQGSSHLSAREVKAIWRHAEQRRQNLRDAEAAAKLQRDRARLGIAAPETW